MPDSSDIDNALVAKLGADGALLAIAPHGVYMDEAPAGSTKFVIVSLIDAVDIPEFGRRTIEDALYLVKVVMLSTAGGNVKAGAARIDVLLEDGTLTVPGYGLMTMHREARLRQTEVDEVDATIRWQHRGGHYRVTVAVN